PSLSACGTPNPLHKRAGMDHRCRGTRARYSSVDRSTPLNRAPRAGTLTTLPASLTGDYRALAACTHRRQGSFTRSDFTKGTQESVRSFRFGEAVGSSPPVVSP